MEVRTFHCLLCGSSLKLGYTRQTVFYLGDAVAVDEGDEITGVISVAPNARNPRDLDIVIDLKAQGEAAQGYAEKREYRMA